VLAACTAPAGYPEFSDSQRARALAAAEQVDGSMLQAHVAALVAARGGDETEVPPWGDGKPLSRLASAAYLTEQIEANDLEAVSEDTAADEVPCSNIYVDIPGATRREELVLITAHFDSWYLGADDNASGVAVLLEAARVLTAIGPGDRTIRIVGFDREEEGLVCSGRYQAGHEDDDVVALINLDAVGYADARPGSQKSLPGIDAPDTGDFLAILASEDSRDQAARAIGLARDLPAPLHAIALVVPGDGRYPGLGNLMRSDHAWFWRAGVPALFFTDTADFRNPNYHEAGDLPETLDYDFLARVGQLTVGAAVGLAEAE
jgi:Zn-dependent M28 family amino/carboxypeptidase